MTSKIKSILRENWPVGLVLGLLFGLIFFKICRFIFLDQDQVTKAVDTSSSSGHKSDLGELYEGYRLQLESFNSDSRLGEKHHNLVTRLSQDIGLDATVDFIIEEFGSDSREAVELLDRLLWSWGDKGSEFIDVLEDPRLEASRIRFTKRVFGAGGVFDGPRMSSASFSSFEELSAPSQNLYGFFLAMELDIASGSEDSLYESIEALKDVRFGTDLVDGFFRQLSRRNAGLAWDQAVEWKKSGSDISEQTVMQIVKNLAGVGFDAAIQKLSSSVETMGVDPLGVVFSKWVNADVNAATQWFENHSGEFEVRNLVPFSVALVESAHVRGEYDTAWEWLETVSDTEVRDKIAGRIWAEEREVVIEKVGKDPIGTLGGIISGESAHPEFWVKEAFTHWNEVNASEAAEWYETNRETLSPAQNQHVARVYAEKSISDGDLQSARDWVKQVVDTRFHNELLQQISVAQQGGN